jgi:hypothetical protein
MMLLAAGFVPALFAFVPGLFLIYYGRVLRQGRALCSALDR